MIAPSIIPTLKNCFLFENFSAEELEALAPYCRILNRRAGEVLFREGDPATEFYVLLSGQVQAFKTSPDGKEIILHLFQSGNMFAEFPVFSEHKNYPVSTSCLQDSALLSIQGKGFRTIAAHHPQLLLKMLGVLSERLRAFTVLIEDLSLRSVEARLAKYLLSLSENAPNKALIHIHKKTLAAILGTVPETLSRTFKKLVDSGLIEIKGTQVQLLCREQLTMLAGQDPA